MRATQNGGLRVTDTYAKSIDLTINKDLVIQQLSFPQPTDFQYSDGEWLVDIGNKNIWVQGNDSQAKAIFEDLLPVLLKNVKAGNPYDLMENRPNVELKQSINKVFRQNPDINLLKRIRTDRDRRFLINLHTLSGTSILGIIKTMIKFIPNVGEGRPGPDALVDTAINGAQLMKQFHDNEELMKQLCELRKKRFGR